MILYNANDFQELKDVGALVAECFTLLHGILKPGITTKDIDTYVKDFAVAHNLKCATNGYRGFPANCCTSVNHVACHGIPSKNKVLKAEDIISIDLTFINMNGYYGDSCRTFFVDREKSSAAAKIVNEVALTALWTGMKEALPGNNIGHIGYAIQKYVENETSCSVVRDYVGHGIGKSFHESPSVPHTCSKEDVFKTPLIEPGMVFTIEPIITFGKNKLSGLNDGWTTVTSDRSLSAQYEHTIGITRNGYEVFTQ